MDCIFPRTPAGAKCVWTGSSGKTANFSCLAGATTGSVSCGTFAKSKSNCCDSQNQVGSIGVSPAVSPPPSSPSLTPVQIQEFRVKILDVQKSLLELALLKKESPNDPSIAPRLAEIAQKILELSNRLKALAAGAAPAFARNLSFGSTGDDVRKLQEFLAKDKTIYPEGAVNGYFDVMTQRAVQRFQCKYNIVCSGAPQTTGYGAVGPKTMAKLNELVAK